MPVASFPAPEAVRLTLFKVTLWLLGLETWICKTEKLLVPGTWTEFPGEEAPTEMLTATGVVVGVTVGVLVGVLVGTAVPPVGELVQVEVFVFVKVKVMVPGEEPGVLVGDGVKVLVGAGVVEIMRVMVAVRFWVGVGLGVLTQGNGVRVLVGGMGQGGGVPVRVFVGVVVRVEVLGGKMVAVCKWDILTGWPETDPENDNNSELQWTDPATPPELRAIW